MNRWEPVNTESNREIDKEQKTGLAKQCPDHDTIPFSNAEVVRQRCAPILSGATHKWQDYLADF
jgi:hypothetical protein